MRFEAFVAARYLRGKRKNRFIGLITFISIAGVSVGVIALIVVMSVMTGFQNALRQTIIGNRAHLQVFERFSEMHEPDEVRRRVEGMPHVEAAAPFIEVRGLLEHQTTRQTLQEAAFVMGVDPELESAVTDLKTNLGRTEGRIFSAGRLPEFKEIVLGHGLARNLGVGVGSTVSLFTPRTQISPTGPRIKPVWLTVSGIAHTQMSEYDLYYGWVDLETAAVLTGDDTVTGVHVKLDDPFLAEQTATAISEELGYAAVTWYESNRAFFEALKQEKLVMFIILTFIVLVAVFNITSTLIMMVMEKRRDIGILRTIGVSTRSVLTLFIFEGLFIGVSGTLLGVGLGWLLAHNINAVAEFIAGALGIELWDTTIYYFDRIPSEVVPADVGVITVASILLTFLSTIYPAWSASRVDPVEALRYE